MNHAHAHGRLGATAQWSCSLSFTFPTVAFEVTKMLMHLRHLTDLV
jgi:flavin reductase (DIM6/NTAB) family NADH-FMN oxidoreductase RutF